VARQRHGGRERAAGQPKNRGRPGEGRSRDDAKTSLSLGVRPDLVFEANPEPAWLFDTQSLRIGAVNEAAIEKFGYSRNEFVRLKLSDLHDPQEQPPLSTWLAAIVARPEGARVDFHCRTLTKRDTGLAIDATWVRLGATDHGDAVLALLRDVTAQRRAEEALAKKGLLLDAVTAAAPVILWAVNDKGTITLSEGRGLAALGLQPGDHVGRSVFEIYAPFPAVIENVNRALRGEVFVADVDIGAATFQSAFSPLRSPDGVVTGVLGVSNDITEIRRAGQALEQRRAFLRQIIDTVPSFIFARDREGRYTLVNQAVADARGRSVKELAGKTDLEIEIPAEEAARFRRNDLEVFSTGRENRTTETITTDAAGRPRWFQTVRRPLFGPDGQVTHVLSVATDITEERRALAIQAALFKVAATVRLGTDVAAVCREIHAIVGGLMPAANFYIALLDEEDGMLSFPYFVDEHDARPQPKKPGRGLTEYVLRTGEPLLASPETFAQLKTRGDVDLLGADSVDWLGVPLQSDNRTVGVLVVQSYRESVRYGESEKEVLAFVSQHIAGILARKRAEKRIAHQAYHDLLTGLPNRLLLTDRLALAMARAKRSKKPLAVMLLDVDRFKVLNDTLGHSAGDQLLQGLATRLKACVRKDDTVARLGGDEFILLLPDLALGDVAARMAEKILAVTARPFQVGSQEYCVTVSLGIAFYPIDGGDAETLLANADSAMYRAKELGRNTYQLSAPGMNNRARQRLMLEMGLRRAVERGELALAYQPIVDVASRAVVGTEALLRWRHPELGQVAPDTFIPVAEESGLIVGIGEWALNEACRQTKAWQDEGFTDLRVAVNLSGRQFQHEQVAGIISSALLGADLRPKSLELEITESVAMKNLERTAGILRALRSTGVRVSIDDFGTGQSSLSYLKHLPLNTLKVDRTFVEGIGIDTDDEAIVHAVVALAQSLKLRVIAEGVETESQIAFLAERGCQEFQGHFFSPALPPGDVRGKLGALAR
jgi:diguanylate cyclase (GGDEF)-like protein/PAS domain S-box-containing protein